MSGLDLEVEGVLANLILGVQTEGSLEGRHGDGVVEGLILVEPLHGEVVLTRLLEGLVDRGQVLQAALG